MSRFGRRRAEQRRVSRVTVRREASRRRSARTARAAETGAVVTVPSPALAQVIRAPQRQVRLARLIRQPGTAVVPLDRADALEIGRLLSGSAGRDVVDAHVVLCARRTGNAVLTSDPDDLTRLDPSLRVVVV